MEIIAITGGYKTGKTTLLNFLSQKGYFTINTDEVNGSIVKFFNIDKDNLRSKIFKKKINYFQLTCIILLVIYKVLVGLIKAHKVIIIEIPLLYEYKIDRLFFHMVVVADRNAVDRRCEKNVFISDFYRIHKPLEIKMRYCDVVVDNNGSLEDLRRAVDKMNFDGLNLYQELLILIFVYFVYKSIGK